MALDLSPAKLIGPALPEPFVKFDLEKILNQNNLLLKVTGKEGKRLQEFWNFYRRKLRDFGSHGGKIRVKNYIIDPLVELLGYSSIEDGGKINTREGDEDGGYILKKDDHKSKLRIWTVETGRDLEAPIKRGYAYRFSFVRIAQRVLLATQERLGIITDGLELRLLISDPAMPNSQVVISIDHAWKRSRNVADTFRFLVAICSSKGIELLPEIVDKARLKQSTITKELRIQARQAIECFIQEILDDPQNKSILDNCQDKMVLSKTLWHEGLIIVYRLLFVLKGEASDDPARSFKFTSSSIWRNTYSPTVCLVSFVRKAIDEGADTGTFLEKGLRTIFKMFAQGVKSVELNVAPLGGELFGENSTPLLSQLHWPEMACAKLLDKLLWTLPSRRRAQRSRERIHYGSLDIEDLGRVYETLLELEPGIASEDMCRLKRSKLEVVVPYLQGEKYREDKDTEGPEESEEIEDAEGDNRSTNIKWIEKIREGQFYLRVGLGRKSTGSYYTPHSFVRFLVQETLGPKLEEYSPKDNPYPNKILKLKVLDPAMGSGHFLVEACRFMADKLYESCRLCDEKALEFERKLEREKDIEKKREFKKLADEWRNRIIEIPDPEDEILKYLPSSAPEGIASGLSLSKAKSLCKRLIAVHCLYGVDKNPLAVELAKLSLWLESQSEGLPLTFLDHRLVIGNSITGPFFEHLLKSPGSQEELDSLFSTNLREKFTRGLKNALSEIKELEQSVGIDISDITNKQKAKERLESCLLPFKILAAAWAGGVMLSAEECDDLAYVNLAKRISEIGKMPDDIQSDKLLKSISKGLGVEEESLSLKDILLKIKERKIIPALSYDLTFPEVFFELFGDGLKKKGFDVVLGNPPWESIRPIVKEFFTSFDINMAQLRGEELDKKIEILLTKDYIKKKFKRYINSINNIKMTVNKLYTYQKIKVEGDLAGRWLDLFRIFVERSIELLNNNGYLGQVLPDSFHINAGATGIRRLCMQLNPILCFSFKNTRNLFDIGAGEEFDIVVVQKKKLNEWRIAITFGIEDPSWLFSYDKNNIMYYSKAMLNIMGGAYSTIMKLENRKDLELLESIIPNCKPLRKILNSLDIKLQTNPAAVNMGKESAVFIDTRSKNISGDPRNWEIMNKLLKEGITYLHEKGTFYKYNDLFHKFPRNLVFLQGLTNFKDIYEQIRYYRLVGRKVIHSGEIFKSVFCFISPGGVVSDSAMVEAKPYVRSNYKPLLVLPVLNSYTFDYLSNFQVALNLSLFILKNIPVLSNWENQKSFLIHTSLKLTCNHKGYLTLWQEQLGNNWREPNKKPFTWPVLKSEEEKWETRSAIDAVVADAYGLSRDQYEHILKSFDRASAPNPHTEICLAKFDELKEIGLEAFTKKYDPYWDIPLNEELPKPVIDIPIPEGEDEKDLFGEKVISSKKKRRRK